MRGFLRLADHSTGEGIACLAGLEDVQLKVRLLLPHLLDLVLVLVLLRLLTHLEEVRVEDLVRVQSVAIWVVLLVVALVSPFKLDVAPCKSCHGNALVCLVVVLISLLIDSLHLVALVL